MKSDQTTAILVVVIVASLIVVLFILASGANGGMMGGGGMIGGGTGYALSDIDLVILAIAVIALIGSVILLIPILTGSAESAAPRAIIPQTVASTPLNVVRDNTDNHLISRLLDGDERNLYQMIASADGEVFQKDLVSKKVFSKAKVTRLLDKLEERGLIVRERYGATNKIKIVK